MTADVPTGPKRAVTAEFWVRSLGQLETVEQQTEFVDRLARLETAGILEGVDVDVWGGRLVLSAATARTAPGRRFLTRYQRFQDWADRAGATLEPFFETTDAVSSFTGEAQTLLVFPVHTLAEFDGDEVVHVAPSIVDGEVRTVADRLAVLEARADVEAVTDDEKSGGGDGEAMTDDGMSREAMTDDGEGMVDGRTVTVGSELAGQDGAGGTDETGTPERDRADEPERWVGDWPATLVDPAVGTLPHPSNTER